MHYLDFLSQLHVSRSVQHYVEIGVRNGAAICKSRGKAIGIDPNFSITHEFGNSIKFFRETSDDFFEKYSVVDEFYGKRAEMVFIDGLHLSEFALRDFINSEACASRDGIIVFDDVLPRNAQEALRKPTGGDWTGDVWKVLEVLREYRPDLRIDVVKTKPTGLAIVSNLDPQNSHLKKQYSTIEARLLSNEFNLPSQTEELATRFSAISPDEYIVNNR